MRPSTVQLTLSLPPYARVQPLPPVTVIFSKWDLAHSWSDKRSPLRQSFAATLASLDAAVPGGYGVLRVSCEDGGQVQSVFDTVVKVSPRIVETGSIFVVVVGGRTRAHL